VFTKWLGESEEAIRQIFRVARQLAPSIIFFDQLDALAPRRGADSGSRTTERVVNQLLAELDGIRTASSNVVVISATNRIDLVDPSILRPGRLGMQVLVPLPGFLDRVEIFTIELAGHPLREDSIEKLAERCDGFSGADIHAVCIQARMNALRRGEFREALPLTRDDFWSAIAQVGNVSRAEEGGAAAAA
jgi:transitional endoplasmic reticulum ATPase